jgi:PAS domain S-box-containing protein
MEQAPAAPRRSILVVEKDPVTQTNLVRALRAAGYAVTGAGDARTALECVVQDPPDLVLQNLVLPDMDGLVLARKLRAMPGGEEIVLVALSGVAAKLDEARGIDLGFARLLFKPMEPSKVVAVIASLVPLWGASAESRPGCNRDILLVDSDGPRRRLQRLRLEEQGFRVRTASDGAEGLAEARRSPPDAIVSDLLMPRMDGLELCRAIRQDAVLEHVPFVLTSPTFGSIEEADRRMAGSAGVSAFASRTPSLDQVVGALLASLAGDRPPVPTRVPDAETLRTEYTARIVRQLEHHATLNMSLAQDNGTKTAQLAILTAVAAVMAQNLDLDAVLNEVVARAIDITCVSIAAVYLLEADGRPQLACQLGYPAAARGLLGDFFGRMELIDQVIAEGATIRVSPSELTGTAMAKALLQERALSITLVPLIAAGARLGVLVVGATDAVLGEEWIEIVEAVGMQVGQAVALARSMNRVRESEQRYRAWFTNMPIGLLRSTPSGQMLDVNPALVELLGYPDRGALLSVDAKALYADAEDRMQFQARLQNEPAVHGCDFDMLRADGSVISVRAHARAIRDATGGIESYEGGIEDITEQRQLARARTHAEEALRQNLGLLRSVVEGTTDAIFVKDLNGRYLLANAAAAAMIHVAPEALIGRDDTELFPPEEAGLIAAADRGVVESGETRVYEEVLAMERGKSQTFLSSKGVFRNRDGQVAGIFGISRDITKFRDLESQLRQSQKMEAVGRLAGGIAHDFNNVLSAIMSNADLLREDLPSGDGAAREEVEEIIHAARRAAGLTRQLLAFSRQQLLEPRVINLNDVVAGVEKMLRRIIGEDVELVTRLAPDLGLIKADPGQLEQVIMNLAVNARDAMPDGGKLTIETAPVDLSESYAAEHAGVAPGPYVMLAVSDTGCGMDADTQARMFEPFFTTKEQGKGTGLGLATVHGIVNQSGGFVWVYSELNHGTTFKVYLPHVEGIALTRPTPTASVAQSPRGHETILFVEDEDALRRVGREILVRQGYTILAAAGGAEALATAAEHHGVIDMVATDVVMPGMSGTEVVTGLRALHPRAKVLYMSGYTDDAVVRRGIVAPGMAFLQKPFSAATLARKVREVFDRPES